jgi:hypothetical protein
MYTYEDARNLSPGEGKLCTTLGELVAFVTGLVADQSLLEDLQYNMLAARDCPEPHRWWFRGSCSDYKLNAGLFRTKLDNKVRFPKPPPDYGSLERKIQHEYALMTRGRFPGLSSNPWDRLFEMQHYGLPTRLLDWTFNLGQAIWFALQPPNSSNRAHKPVIWILNPRLLSKASLGEEAVNDFAYLELNGTCDDVKGWEPTFKGPFDCPGRILKYLSNQPQGHFPVLASWTNPRMAAQMGCFTLQSGVAESKSPSLEEYAKEVRDKKSIQFLLQVCLDPKKSSIEKASDALSLIGINEYTLFPELEKTCAWIKKVRQLQR